ncbi:mechanosensitive ion channel [Photobacterium phosphoreum]|uniref:Small-conductance mechanosensitive channel n=2 Tax=Photobacterium TaxID=657 RepID=A0A2N4UNN5_9GAMM|nr:MULTISPECIES: mechanosensitive ion channel domain-containing protein [Photobacterium]KAE8175754.1 mechanosensitive ion channel protein MscS [Photobacterium carnosum]MBY3790692.1 mechanosensitive ion channel [Photobacterium carnosum]MCD9465136.1 mechanosensitive ion channel protein MscS [Photobacterium phosphoreum]MCD9472651.1 mechanosensitive ion channel protein MscS [Photobacterium phosphoreum]MCD9476642.1 mechanosensitive ion channel [Photobacterium phosphoreum]
MSLFQHPIMFKFLIGMTLFIVYIICKVLIYKAISSLANAKGVKVHRAKFIQRSFSFSLLFILISLFLITTGIGYGDVSVFISSIFAVLGVAFIAQWSILSNITASLLIFFVFPYRVGDVVKIVDKDEDISGEIIDIRIFHVLIKHDNGNLITYPNTLILQKAVIKISKHNLT